MITVAMRAALNRPQELKTHLRAALTKRRHARANLGDSAARQRLLRRHPASRPNAFPLTMRRSGSPRRIAETQRDCGKYLRSGRR
jgi:hypothetical protein